MHVIEVRNVDKRYPARRGGRAFLGRGGLADWLRRKDTAGPPVLQDISFNVGAGESLGIIGRNGSGKSTLLKMLAGVTLPTRGEIAVRGRIASLLELGAGFHPMLTGRENVYLNAGLLGLRHRQVDEIFEQIAAFSGIEPFIDQPVDTYSSGMYVRIAFAVAVHVNPDVFLVDEVLAVGDEAFQRQCRAKIGELREQGKTIVFVSHDLGVVGALCDRVLLLDQGRLISRGNPQDTIDYYLRQVGRESGVCRLNQGAIEALFNHGRLAIYHEERELTAPAALQALFISRGVYHASSGADWTITGKTPEGFHAEAVLPRLPVRIQWAVSIDSEGLTIELSYECTAPAPLDGIAIQLCANLRFARWIYGEHEGKCPAIEPGDMTHVPLHPGEPGAREAAFLGDAEESDWPVLRYEAEPASPHWMLQIENSDYVTGARIALLSRQFPPDARPLPVGAHGIGRIRISLDRDARAVTRRRLAARALRTLEQGPYEARLERGAIALFHEGAALTAAPHLHVQCCIGRLWFMSQSMRWDAPVRTGDSLACTGAAVRFPIRQHWRLSAVGAGRFHIEILLEAMEAVEIDEYNVSLGLAAEFTHWSSVEEEGVFPETSQDEANWRHLNRIYPDSRRIEAWGAGLPHVALEANDAAPPLRMTALNTGHVQRARVLQAIRAPEAAERLCFEAGEHLLFDGCLVAGAGRGAA